MTATWSDTDRAKKPLRSLRDKGEDATMRELEEVLTLGRQPSHVIVKRLTATAQLDITDLRPALEARAQEIVTRESAELVKIGVTEAKSLRELLEAQRKRIAEARREADDVANAPKFDLFASDEKRQLDFDRRHWVRKLEQLDRDAKIEPQRIVDGYTVRAHLLEPVGLVYLWPETN